MNKIDKINKSVINWVEIDNYVEKLCKTKDVWERKKMVELSWFIAAGFDTGLKALGAGRHCSIARSKSKSHRRKISSSTDLLRCGNKCASISIALSDTFRESAELLLPVEAKHTF